MAVWVVGVWRPPRFTRGSSSAASDVYKRQVIFHGQKMNEELDELFNEADFAIGSLARHRSGIDKIKTLKNREYAARGIPFIYSETDEDFDPMPYIMKVPADESPIDIHRLEGVSKCAPSFFMHKAPTFTSRGFVIT